MKSFWSSWKTTLAGLAVGGLTLYANGTGWKEILLALGISVLGGVAKDKDVSGGGTTVLPNAVPDPKPLNPEPLPTPHPTR